MGLSSFLKRSNEPPPPSAFDAIPDEVRQAIANDIGAMIECVKCWRVAIQSPEHGKAMFHEVMNFLRSVGGKLVTAGLSGNLESAGDMFATPEALAKLNIPAAIRDIANRVKDNLKPLPAGQCDATDSINHETGERVRCDLVVNHIGNHKHQLAANSFVEWTGDGKAS